MTIRKTSACKYDKLNCLNLKTINPLEYQKNICKFLMNDKYKGVLVFHSVGSGKTITSLLAANCLLQKYPNKNVIITTGTSLVHNFEKEIKKLGFQDDDRITVTSYGIFINRLKIEINSICKDNILIIDEAQNFGRKGVRSDYLLKCAKKAFKVILLTATPVNNKPEEIINLMNMITTKDVEKDVKEALKDIYSDKFKKVFKCKVSFYKSSGTENYPTTKEHIIKLKMTREYYAEYYKIQEDMKDDLPEIFTDATNLTVFLNGARRAVNKTKTVSPKIEWTINKIIEDLNNNKKILIYSSWKAAGINIIKDFLKTYDIKYSEVSGELSKEKRKELVSDYNLNKTKVIIITAAGAEGLDLKGTRTIIILEPHWNEARTEQIVGRGVRYGSHSHLPENERHVDIFYILLYKPDKIYITDNILSADRILREISLRKSGEINEFYKNLEKISIEKNKKCIK